MAFPRLAFRTITRAGSRATARTWQRSSRRGYTSGASPEKPPSSDLPWALASVGFTAPAVWYMLQPETKATDAHAPGHEHVAGHAREEALAAEEKEEATQPTVAKIESQIETAVKQNAPESSPVSEAERDGVNHKAADGAEQEAKKTPQPAMTEETSAEEAKAEKSAVAPGEHPVVPDTAVQSAESPSKKGDMN